MKESCVKESVGPIIEESEQTSIDNDIKEVVMEVARVGKKAPDFEATAFQDGAFRNVKLSELMGKWIVVCFYPGDFTFV